MNWQNNRVMVALGFYLSLGIMVSLVIFSFLSIRDLIRYNELLNRSVKVHEVLDEVRALVLAAESSQRGFILTGNERFLASYRKEVKDIPFKFTVLRHLTGGHPRCQQLIDALDPLIDRKLALLQERISAMEAGNREAVIQSVKSEVGLQLMSQINLVIGDLEKEENQVLAERKAGVEAMRRRALLAMVIGSPFSFGILILIFYCLKREIAGRRRTAEALHLSEERLRIFMENSPAISFMKDLEGKYVFVNGLIEQLSSRKPGELVGKTDPELWPPEVAQQFQAMDQLVFAEEKPVEIMTVLPDRGGNSRDFLIYEFPIPSHQGKRLLGGVAVDITQGRAAEAALQRAAQEFRMVVNNIPAVVFKGYVDGTVDFFDDQVERVTGYAREEFEGHRRSWQGLIFSEDLATAKESFVRALKGSGLYVREYRIRTKAEEVLWIQERSCIVRQPDGKVDYISGVFFDITARKRGEEALRESEENFRGLFETSPDVVAQTDLNLNFLIINNMAEPLFGYENAAQLIGTNFLDLVDPADHPQVLEDAKKLFETGTLRNAQYTFMRKGGTRFPGEVSATVTLDAAGVPKTFTGTIRDITERKQAEESLKESYARLRASLEGTVKALSAVVESKDPYTAGHQRRVTHLACAIAQEMGLSPDQVEGIRVMGYLHDIGKIAVPAEILSRPGKINAFEFNLIKQHPISGSDILKQIAFPWPVAQAVAQHHERLDGSGYPSGLADHEIILEARVLAVADVVEAMASHRPYRPALDIEQALAEIAQNKGTLYDPGVVEACLRLFRAKNFDFD